MDDKKLNVDEYPSNSHKVREKKEEIVPEKKRDKIIKGTVVQKKRPLGKRLSETFLGDDMGSVAQYILHDVIIPATKSTIIEMVSGGIEMLMGGGVKGSRTYRNKGKSHVSYNSMSRDKKEDRREVYSRNSRAGHSFDDIILESRGEAEEVLSNLVDLTEDYDQATVADLYDLVGINSNYTDGKYGWTNLASASVSRVRDGYLINLPKTKELS